MEHIDIEKINRKNFRALMEALATPGEIKKVNKLFDSYLLGVASVLLYSEVSFYYKGKEEMELVEAIANPNTLDQECADYIFADSIDSELLKGAKIGTFKEPDLSSTLVFCCKEFNGLELQLSGPGIKESTRIALPLDAKFIELLREKNSEYPTGVELYFLNENGEILALSRTTKVEVA